MPIVTIKMINSIDPNYEQMVTDTVKLINENGLTNQSRARFSQDK